MHKNIFMIKSLSELLETKFDFSWIGFMVCKYVLWFRFTDAIIIAVCRCTRVFRIRGTCNRSRWSLRKKGKIRRLAKDQGGTTKTKMKNCMQFLIVFNAHTPAGFCVIIWLQITKVVKKIVPSLYPGSRFVKII